MAIQLTITQGKGRGKDFVFSQNRVRIGRQPDNDLVLYDTGVSRHHCEIFQEGGAFTLRDLGSANGTKINDDLVTESRLTGGDAISIGPITFVFEKNDGQSDIQQTAVVSRPDLEVDRRSIEEDRTVALRREDIPDFSKELKRRGQSGNGAIQVLRTATGSFQAYRKSVSSRFLDMPRSARIGAIAGTALAVIGSTIFAWVLLTQPPVDRSREVFVISPEIAASRFGFGKVDISTPDSVTFRFTYEGGKALVTYAAGGVDKTKEVQIRLNEKAIGYVPTHPKWTKDIQLALPREYLVEGTNILVFDNTLCPPATERWGIAQVRLTQTALPPPDPEKSARLRTLGQDAYKTRSVAPQNLARSIEYFTEAALYLEGLKSPSPQLAQIYQEREKATAELNRIFATHMFSARKADRFGDRKAGIATLKELLEFFPDSNHPKHKDVKNELLRMAGGQRWPDQGAIHER